jgi:hypothetical protein
LKNVVFTFREGTQEEQRDKVLQRIRALPGVSKADRLKPDATKPVLRRLGYASVADAASADQLVDALRKTKEIESAELPAERGLGPIDR